MRMQNEEKSFLKHVNVRSKADRMAPGTLLKVPNTLFPVFPLKPTYPGLFCFAANKQWRYKDEHSAD